MKTVSGVLQITKTEAKNIRVLLDHARKDLAYGGEGTYWSGKDDRKGYHLANKSDMRKSIEAIVDIEWMLDTFTN
jgi:hypothetical protein